VFWRSRGGWLDRIKLRDREAHPNDRAASAALEVHTVQDVDALLGLQTPRSRKPRVGGRINDACPLPGVLFVLGQRQSSANQLGREPSNRALNPRGIRLIPDRETDEAIHVLGIGRASRLDHRADYGSARLQTCESARFRTDYCRLLPGASDLTIAPESGVGAIPVVHTSADDAGIADITGVRQTSETPAKRSFPQGPAMSAREALKRALEAGPLGC